MIFPVILETLTVTIGIIIGIIFSIILFVSGIFLTRSLARKKNLDVTFTHIFIVNLIWLVLDVSFVILISYLLSDNLIIELLLISINIIVATLFLKKVLKKKLRDTIIFVVLIQIFLFAITIGMELLLGFTLYSLRIEDLTPPPLVFLLFIVFIIGAILFYVQLGDKMQIVENKNLIVLISIIPGIIYFSYTFFLQYAVESSFIISFVVSIVLALIIKRIAFKMVQFREIGELEVLEKGIYLLEVKNLKIYFPLLGGILKRQVGTVKAVDGVTYKIKTGETLGIVGESGCGKTTIALAILGLVEKTEGEILFHNKPIPSQYSKYLRQKVQTVFQDPDASLNPRKKVVDIIAEPLINLLGITRKTEIRRHVLKLLDQVSLKREHLDRYPHEFSGGQKQRIVIARALACNPELIVLDEPTSALDVSVQAQILNLLKDLQTKYGYGFIFITHNLAVVNHIADRIAVMYLGKFVEVGNTEQIFSNPTHPYTQALLASLSEIDPYDQDIKFVIEGEVPSPIAPPPGCNFNPRCVSDARTKECEFEIPHKIEIEDGHYIWCVNPPILKI